jgi:hypothetical protein
MTILTDQDLLNGLSNYALLDIAKKMGMKLNGIYMRNELNKKNFKPGLYIVNIASSENSTGVHWVALYYGSDNTSTMKDNELIYFDSYGAPPVQDIVNLMPQDLHYNKRQIQDYHSTYCGLFAILFLYAMRNSHGATETQLGTKFNNFLALFTLNKKKLVNNNAAVLEAVNKIINN